MKTTGLELQAMLIKYNMNKGGTQPKCLFINPNNNSLFIIENRKIEMIYILDSVYPNGNIEMCFSY